MCTELPHICAQKLDNKKNNNNKKMKVKKTELGISGIEPLTLRLLGKRVMVSPSGPTSHLKPLPSNNIHALFTKIKTKFGEEFT